MSEPWFDPNAYGWIAGTMLGLAGGTLGPLVGTLVPRGKAKSLVFGLWWAAIAASAALLAAGVVGLLSGQPYGVWYGLGLPGVVGIVLFPALLPVVRQRYREAEERKMQSMDLS